MVARFCRLRIALLLTVFRGPFSHLLRNLLVGVTAIASTIALAGAPLVLIPEPVEREAIDTVLFALVIIAPGVVAFFFNRPHLEPRHFNQLPAHWANIGISFLLSSLVSWPVLWFISWLVVFTGLREELHRASWWLLLAALAAVLVVVITVRITSALSQLLVPPRSQGALRALGALLLVSLLPVIVFAVAETVREPGAIETSEIAQALAHTPFGAPLDAVLHAAERNTSAALGALAIVLAYLVLVCACWLLLVRASLQSNARPADALLSRRSMGWFDRFSSRPAAVIGARALTYWGRDPRYRVALAAAPIGAVLAVVSLAIAGVDVQHIALVPLPLMLLLLGWSLHNDIASDSTAIWMHIASGTRGRDDRAGRLVPVLMLGAIAALVGSSLTVTVTGDWRILPSVLGMNIAVLLVACGVSSVWSALRPYPTTRPGDSPFAQPAVAGAGGGTAQTLSMLVTLLLIVPPVWIAVASAINPSLGSEIFALIFGLIYGGVVLTVGVLGGGMIFDRVGPRYIALTQTFD